MKLDFTEKSKTETGREEILKEIYSYCRTVTRRNDLYCWEMYHNKFRTSEYEYLRKFGDYELPATVKHIPKQRPYIDYLTSKQSRRPFVFSVNVVDKTSVEKKYKNKISDFLDKHLLKYKEMYFANIGKIGQLEAARQQIIQQLQQEPQGEEQALQQQQIHAQLPQITAQIEYIKDVLTNENIYTQKEIDRLNRYYKYDKKELVEELAQKAVRSLRQKLNINRTSLKNFIAHTVIGRQYYYVDYRVGDNVCKFGAIAPHKVFYPATEDIEWVQELDWAGFEEQMSYSDILIEFEDDLTIEQKNELKERGQRLPSSVGGIFVATEGQTAILDTDSVDTGSANADDGRSVVRVWWVAQRTLRAISSPNPHVKDDTFTNFVNDDHDVINEDDYYYNKKKRVWVKKSDESVEIKYDKVKTYSTKKGQGYEKRVIYDLYRGVVIDDFVFIAKKSDTQPRFVDNYSKMLIPIIGPTFNSITNQPYSLLWATRDIQKLYNIVNYHRELMLAVAGTKVMLMDMFQKPEGMSDDEWRYQMKMGVAKIQTRKKGIGPGLQPTFNQFQVYDMSLSSSIQYLEKILEGLDEQIGMIMGVTRPTMGQIVNTDQVGTFQLSQQSSSMVTEIIYANHDEIERQALNMLLHLSKTYIWDKETIIQILTSDGAEELVKIPDNLLNLSDYDIQVVNNTKEENSLAELKQIALNHLSSGRIPLNNFISMYRIESLMELEKMIQHFDEKAQEIMQQNAGNEVQAKANLEKMKIELQAQYDAKIEEQRFMLEQANLKLEQDKMISEDKWREITNQLEEKKLAQDRYLKLYELVNERESEDNAVMLNDKHSTVDEQIRVLELKLNALISTQQLEQQEKDSQRSDKQTIKKIQVEDKKANKMVKEHVSDK